ncbi:hypothetical protein D3C81_1309650 [compost metagenome]
MTAVVAFVRGALGDETGAFVVAAAARHVALGKNPLTVVIAQLAVGERHDFAAAVVVAKQRAATQRGRHRQVEVVEYGSAQIDVAIHAFVEPWQLFMLRRQGQVEAP